MSTNTKWTIFFTIEPNEIVPYSLVEDYSIKEMTVIIQAMERIEKALYVDISTFDNLDSYFKYFLVT